MRRSEATLSAEKLQICELRGEKAVGDRVYAEAESRVGCPESDEEEGEEAEKRLSQVKRVVDGSVRALVWMRDAVVRQFRHLSIVDVETAFEWNWKHE